MVSESGIALRYPELLDQMGEALAHRGPDGRATLASDSAAIGTARLRIIDLHERADQPFATPAADVWLECNGEIYNAVALRARYPDYPFRSHSDVETILPLYLEHGTAAIDMLDGMFGLAIWDSRSRTLILARDRAGEKPLFYARIGHELLFASELQSILRHPGVSRELDRTAVADYLSQGYVSEPRTMFKAIRRVPAGCFIRFTGDGERAVRYWDVSSFPIEPRDPAQAVTDLRKLVEEAVRKQVISDVPVGVFVSGGLDSSILAALASRTIGVDKVHTFSAKFAEQSYDESSVAARVAQRMRTTHVPVLTDERTLLEALQAVTRGIAEPIADPAVLPTYLLAREARKYVRVVLSGEGADELFGGYPTYIGHKVAPIYDALPAPIRRAIRAAVGKVPASNKKVTVEFLLKKFVSDAERPWIERHRAWFGTGLAAEAAAVLPERAAEETNSSNEDALAGAMLLDYSSYLRDNLLVKVDRATMLSSVEARAPFLDRDVTRFAFSTPVNLRVRGVTTKWVLKKAAEAWLPHDVIYRRKRGLSVPIANWLNDGLRSEVDRLLAPERLRREGLVNEPYITGLLAEHRSGHANHAKALWAVVMLQYWRENWGV
jgi:asparagine synthase (glutamine-hydrolysing)